LSLPCKKMMTTNFQHKRFITNYLKLVNRN
jgi:hypothetical protein